MANTKTSCKMGRACQFFSSLKAVMRGFTKTSGAVASARCVNLEGMALILENEFAQT